MIQKKIVICGTRFSMVLVRVDGMNNRKEYAEGNRCAVACDGCATAELVNQGDTAAASMDGPAASKNTPNASRYRTNTVVEWRRKN